MTSGVALGLVVMLSWGIADFIQTIAIRRIGTPRTMVLRNVLTLAISVSLGGFLWSGGNLQVEPGAFAIAALGSSAYVFGYFHYMRGLEIGSVSVVAPIASSFSVVTVILSVLFADERLGSAEALYMLLIVGGLFLASANFRNLRGFGSQPGIKEALLTMIAFGGAFFILGHASKEMEATSLFVYSALTQSVLFIALGLAAGGRPAVKDVDPPLALVFLAHAFLVNLGWLAYVTGSSEGEVSVIAPLASVFSAVTVLLACAFYRERLSVPQIIGICGVLVGVAAIAAR